MSKFSTADFKGLAAICKARNNNLVTLFSGTKLVFGKYAVLQGFASLGSSAESVGSGIKKLGSTAVNASQAASPGQIVQGGEKLLTACTGIHSISTLKEVLGGDALHTFIGEVTPLIGILTSGYNSCKNWYAVIQGVHTLYKYDDYRLTVLPGDPQAAVDAIQEIIQRNLARDTVNASRNTAAFGTKIAGLFADFGTATTTAIGIANSVASIAMTLCSIGMDIKEMIDANKILEDPSQLDLNVFKASSLLGCYLLTCSDTSSVINISLAEIGTPGWMDKVEKLKKKGFDKLIKLAKKEIKSSRLHLDGLKSDKGTHSDMGYLERKGMEHSTFREAKATFDGAKSSVSNAKDLVVGNIKQKFNDLVLAKLKS